MKNTSLLLCVSAFMLSAFPIASNAVTPISGNPSIPVRSLQSAGAFEAVGVPVFNPNFDPNSIFPGDRDEFRLELAIGNSSVAAVLDVIDDIRWGFDSNGNIVRNGFFRERNPTFNTRVGIFPAPLVSAGTGNNTFRVNTSTKFFAREVVSVAAAQLLYGFKIFIGDRSLLGDVDLVYDGIYRNFLPLNQLQSNFDDLLDVYGREGSGFNGEDYARFLYSVNSTEVTFNFFQSNSQFEMLSNLGGLSFSCNVSSIRCDNGSFSKNIKISPDGQFAYGLVSITAIAQYAGGGLANLENSYADSIFRSSPFLDPILSFDPAFLAAHPDATIEFGLGIGNSLPSVPESPTWLMLIIGFGFVGREMRKQMQKNSSESHRLRLLKAL